LKINWSDNIDNINWFVNKDKNLIFLVVFKRIFYWDLSSGDSTIVIKFCKNSRNKDSRKMNLFQTKANFQHLHKLFNWFIYYIFREIFDFKQKKRERKCRRGNLRYTRARVCVCVRARVVHIYIYTYRYACACACHMSHTAMTYGTYMNVREAFTSIDRCHVEVNVGCPMCIRGKKWLMDIEMSEALHSTTIAAKK